MTPYLCQYKGPLGLTSQSVNVKTISKYNTDLSNTIVIKLPNCQKQHVCKSIY